MRGLHAGAAGLRQSASGTHPVEIARNTWSDLNMDEVNAARQRFDALPDRARRHA